MSNRTADRTTNHPVNPAKDAGQAIGNSNSAGPASSNRQIAGAIIPKEQLTAYQRWEMPSFDLASTAQTGKASLASAVALMDIQQQAHAEGYASGQSAGYSAGIQQAQAEAAQIHVLLQSLQEGLNQIDQQVAQSLLDLSLEVARKMIFETMQVRPEIILEIISEGISHLPHFNQNAHLILHPQDAELVREHMGERLSQAGWRIFTDNQMQRGGCKLETAHSHIDASNAERWRQIVESIGQNKSWQA
ncbi:MAG: Flagellar assembly protein FliH/Type III secretion system HrpE [Candidatus Gallionella acididurans]|uniref:Flagellar assembly protein FliH n=1 Tax=Candidatus Gallionella acididurans TaxID=1796491 RepID=A0A139BXV0_9PROT|nr:MAG: Flagellar assembly protein FliH/Type III secretion system HrpE [Candidatus Gallionella acididurans]